MKAGRVVLFDMNSFRGPPLTEWTHTIQAAPFIRAPLSSAGPLNNQEEWQPRAGLTSLSNELGVVIDSFMCGNK